MSKFVKWIKDIDDYMELGGVLEEEIDDAEQVLNVKFAREYHDYLLECGIATADGHEFTGIGKSKRLSVVNVTQEYRRKNKNIPETLYVIEELGIDKIVIWQSESGEVYQTVAGAKPEKIADSIEEYLK